MIPFDCCALGIVELDDNEDADAAKHAPLAPFDRLAARLLRLPVSTLSGPAELRLAADGPPVAAAGRAVSRAEQPAATPRLAGSRTAGLQIRRSLRRASNRPGCQTTQLEADIERLVDQLAAEVQRLDEDLESLLHFAAR